jgi:superkiller protein 3
MMTDILSAKKMTLSAWLCVAVAVGAMAAPAEPDEIKPMLESLTGEERVSYLRGLKAKGEWGAAPSFYLGNAYLSLDNPDSAIVYYEEAVALDSTYAKAYVNLGIAYDRIKRFDRAKSSFEKAIEVNPQDVLAHCHLGHYYHVRGGLGRAVSYYQMALEIDPESAQAHYNLGLAFADSRLFSEAVREWERVVALSPDSEVGKTAAENVKLIKTYMDIGD